MDQLLIGDEDDNEGRRVNSLANLNTSEDGSGGDNENQITEQFSQIAKNDKPNDEQKKKKKQPSSSSKQQSSLSDKKKKEDELRGRNFVDEDDDENNEIRNQYSQICSSQQQEDEDEESEQKKKKKKKQKPTTSQPHPSDNDKKREEDIEWEIFFSSANNLRTFISILQAFQNTIHLVVSSTSLGVHCMDSANVCMLSGRIEGEGYLANGKHEHVFAVKCDLLYKSLSSLQDDSIIFISYRRGNNVIHIRGQRDFTSNAAIFDGEFNIPLLEEVYDQPGELSTNNTYNTEINLHVLKQLIILSKTFESSGLTITIKEYEKNKKKYMLIDFHAHGDAIKEACFSRKFISCLDEESSDVGGIVHINITEGSGELSKEDVEQFTKVCEASYAVKYIEKFISKIQRAVLTINMGADIPCTITYNLNATCTSFIKISIAPQIND